jgi:hypothetical protein
MKPDNKVTEDCYQFVKDVAGRINQDGGIEIAQKGQFKDLIHKLEGYFIKRYKMERKNDS